MFFKSKFFRALFAVSLLFCLFITVFADTLRLKNGSVIKGKVIGFKDGQFIVLVGDGNRQRQMSFYADEVEKIDFDSSASTPNNSNRPSNSTVSDNNSARPTPTPYSVNSNSSINNSNNVIIVGGNRNTNSNQSNTRPANSNNPSNNNSETNSRPQPITLRMKVLADNTANGWTNTGWVVKRGQKIKISGTGRVSLGNGRYATPSGVSSLPDPDKLVKTEPTGGLVGVIGDDNNDFIFVGNAREFTAQRDGILFLGINESEAGLSDNSGAFDVIIEIETINTK